MKKITQVTAAGSLFASASAAISQFLAGSAYAAGLGNLPSTSNRTTLTPTELATTITNFAMLIVGILSVLMLVWGAIMYITSGGDTSKVTKAKNTILYAVIGIIIALLATAIVNWVNASVTSGNAIQ